jgi:hypothetical protein
VKILQNMQLTPCACDPHYMWNIHVTYVKYNVAELLILPISFLLPSSLLLLLLLPLLLLLLLQVIIQFICWSAWKQLKV